MIVYFYKYTKKTIIKINLLRNNIDQLINSVPKWNIKYIIIQTNLNELTCLNTPSLDLNNWIILVSTNTKCFVIFNEETFKITEKHNKISRDSFINFLKQNKDSITKIAFRPLSQVASI